jgi:hypothetical protein
MLPQVVNWNRKQRRILRTKWEVHSTYFQVIGGSWVENRKLGEMQPKQVLHPTPPHPPACTLMPSVCCSCSCAMTDCFRIPSDFRTSKSNRDHFSFLGKTFDLPLLSSRDRTIRNPRPAYSAKRYLPDPRFPEVARCAKKSLIHRATVSGSRDRVSSDQTAAPGGLSFLASAAVSADFPQG